MNETIKNALVRSGMENVKDYNYYWTCEYNGNHIVITRTIDNSYFSLSINFNTIATRCLYRTLIQKIKAYK